MKIYTIQELKNAPIQIKVYSEEQAIKLAYAVGYDMQISLLLYNKEWQLTNAEYPIYCYLDKFNFPIWNKSKKDREDKPTIIEFNQIENFMIDYTIKGTQLPSIPQGMIYRCSHWDNSYQNYSWSLTNKDYISFGSREYKDEIWILAEDKNYEYKNYFMFKLTDLQELTNNNIENKKIIGYKLIKPEYDAAACKITGLFSTMKSEGNCDITIDSICITELKKAGVLDLWFEPVYEEEFKLGDWITITEVNSSGWLNDTSKRTFQIDQEPSAYAGGIYWGIDGKKALHGKFRKATFEEIANAQKTIVTMYSSNKGNFEIEVVDGKAYYRPENKELPKKWIKNIINSYNNIIICKNDINPYSIKINTIDVGCYSGTKFEDWEKVYKLLK